MGSSSVPEAVVDSVEPLQITDGRQSSRRCIGVEDDEAAVCEDCRGGAKNDIESAFR